jgi:gas vesicle protein
VNSFFKGILVGVGVGFLVAPMRGDEMRRMLNERLAEMRGYLPENSQLNDYVQQVTNRVSQTSSNLKDYAQQAASRVKDTGSSLGDLAQRASSDVKQTGQDVADTTKQAARSTKSGMTSNTTTNTTNSY